jgi:hypothetical protein
VRDTQTTQSVEPGFFLKKKSIASNKSSRLGAGLIARQGASCTIVIPAVIAIVTGTAVLFNKVNHRVTTLDTRVDKLELKLVETYTPKQEFTAAMLRMEDHLIRIEDKTDVLVNNKCK